MTSGRPNLRFALDEGVPNSVGRILEAAGHEVRYLNTGVHIPRGSKDDLVCAFALINDLILVAMDGDMRAIAKGHQVGSRRYARLSLLKISCEEAQAAARVRACMSLIEHEWQATEGTAGRRLFIEIRAGSVLSNR